MAETAVQTSKQPGMLGPLAPLLKNDVLRQLLLLVGIAASVAIGGASVFWMQGKDYRTLYASVAPERASALIDTLTAAGIAYRLEDATGDIQVPADQLHEARIKVAGQGLTNDGSGMAMLEKEQGFGVSEFMQSKKYQYALEQELARTVESLHQVRRARVHLAIPKQSVFIRDRKPPSASVVVDIFPGSNLARNNVEAIINLVSSSISGMAPENVSVIDQQGQLLSNPDEHEDELAVSTKQFAYRQKLEQAYEERLVKLLQPLTGVGRLQVQVSADVDFTRSQESRESWNPDKQVVRSEQINERGVASPDETAAGIPGALSNQPLGTAAAKEEADAANPNASRSVIRNYEIERVLNYRSNSAGDIRKLSVAVVVDNKHSLDEKGKPVSTPLSNPEIQRLILLVKDAVGFDEARGDRVTVISADFNIENQFTEELEAPALWEQPWFANLLRQVLTGLAVLFIVLVVLRPAIRSLTNRPVAALGNTGAMEAGMQGEVMGRPVAALAAPGQAAGVNLEEQVTQVKSSVDQDPKRVAQVINQWVSEQ
ncbi:flagellar M-ring protein FliF [Spongiibacter sp. KMU-158]|uniref:Flagellar M-ring protein n=1 Tax=Spongiibacter pelagi TaxID=2760804 RepID=A0A927C217_9GAMM|nr:flagellar basal-body MS-ring/collar protein FliF [Spongiibacter pelagi]MBD2858432.1 flagellar M-ring protein FliF [Spongiibacter pelagi]